MRVDLALTRGHNEWNLTVVIHGGEVLHAKFSDRQALDLFSQRVVSDVDLAPHESELVQFSNEIRTTDSTGDDPDLTSMSTKYCANLMHCAQIGEGCLCSTKERLAKRGEMMRATVQIGDQVASGGAVFTVTEIGEHGVKADPDGWTYGWQTIRPVDLAGSGGTTDE